MKRVKIGVKSVRFCRASGMQCRVRPVKSEMINDIWNDKRNLE